MEQVIGKGREVGIRKKEVEIGKGIEFGIWDSGKRNKKLKKEERDLGK